MLGFLAAVVAFFVKLWAGRPRRASVEAVAAAGEAQERTVAQVDAGTADVQIRVAQAAVDAPTTQAAVVDQLKRGEF